MTDDRMALQRPRNQNRWPLFGTKTPGSAGILPAKPPYEPSPLSGLEARAPRPLQRHSSGTPQGESQGVVYEWWAGCQAEGA